MTPEQAHLRLVDADGQLVEEHPAEVELRMVQRELQGYRLRLAAKEKEIRDFQEVDPGSEDIQVVGNYHAKRAVETGWWSRRPLFGPGKGGWGAVSARLKEGYDVMYCVTAIDGAFMQPKWDGRRQLKREWLTCKSIFGADNIEFHYERAVDPKMARVPAWMDIAKACRAADAGFLAERCEWCGHMRLEHSVNRFAPLEGWLPCMAEGCVCADFEWNGVAA